MLYVDLPSLASIGGLGYVNAEGSPLLKDDRLGTSGAVPFSVIQDDYGEKPDWAYGPKWGGFGSAYRDRYGYRSYAPQSYGYSSQYQYRVPRRRAR
jgi:hypothetical protein